MLRAADLESKSKNKCGAIVDESLAIHGADMWTSVPLVTGARAFFGGPIANTESLQA
jgi:hypothetical protein